MAHTHTYRNEYRSEPHFGTSWFFWLALVLLLFSNLKNRGYVYQNHMRLQDESPNTSPFDWLNEGYSTSRSDVTPMPWEARGARP